MGARGELDGLEGPVKVLLFTQGPSCEFCPDAADLLNEVATLSDRITVEEHDRLAEPALALAYGVDKAPAFVLEGPAGNRVRFYGLPAEIELTSFLKAIRHVAAGQPAVSKDAARALAAVRVPLRVETFVTPICPWCPPAVDRAVRFATAFPNVTADIVLAHEFPDLVERYDIRSVPTVVVNGVTAGEGDGPDEAFAQSLLRAPGPELVEGSAVPLRA